MDTYNKILEVSSRLFIKQGYTATSIRQIAEETGIGKATIYHHFPDKKAIITALLKKDSFDMQDIINIVKSEEHPRRRIEIAVEYALKSLSKSIDILQIARREIPESRELLQSEYIPFFKEYRTLLSDAIQLGIDQGIFRPINAVEGASVLLTLIQGSFAGSFLSGDRKQIPEDLVSTLLDIYFYGIISTCK